MIICLTATSGESREFTEEQRKKLADLATDYRTCELNLGSCESALQRAINKQQTLAFYQEPPVIGFLVSFSLLVGLVVGKSLK